MKPKKLLDILAVCEKLKCAERHCWTSSGKQESVADHSWRLAVMAYFLKADFPELDMDKVIQMCLLHDLGEAFTGDIPAFVKTEDNRTWENRLLREWTGTFPEPYLQEVNGLLDEMEKRETPEAKLYKALDRLEALIAHNEADIATWLPLEYDLQYTYGKDDMRFSPVLMKLREEVDRVTTEKIRDAKHGV